MQFFSRLSCVFRNVSVKVRFLTFAMYLLATLLIRVVSCSIRLINLSYHWRNRKRWEKESYFHVVDKTEYIFHSIEWKRRKKKRARFVSRCAQPDTDWISRLSKCTMYEGFFFFFFFFTWKTLNVLEFKSFSEIRGSINKTFINVEAVKLYGSRTFRGVDLFHCIASNMCTFNFWKFSYSVIIIFRIVRIDSIIIESEK